MTEQQWLATYRETVRDLFGYLARRTGGNKELCEDIVQESYLRALQSWKDKGLPDSPAAWLKRVAQNILIDYLRRAKWIDESAIRPEDGAIDPPAADPARSLKIFSAIASLGRKKAAILEAFYYEGKSVQEIAAQTRISERAVEGQLRRARRSLKSMLPDLRSNGGKNE